MKKLFVLCTLFVYGALHAITIGSDTTVTRFYTQTSASNGDLVTGFTALQGGLFITDPSASVIWNALFPVSGILTLNAGTLVLQRSLALENISSINSIGTIIGAGYALDFAPSVTTFINGCTQSLVVAQAIGTTPNIGSIGWSFDDQFVAVSGTARTTNSLANYRFNGATLTQVGAVTTATIGVQACLAWRPAAYFLATGGTNGFVRVYSVNSGTGALTQTSSNDQGANVNALAWHPAGRYLVAATSTTANDIVMYPVTVAGVLGTALTLDRPNNAMACDWMVTGTYLAVGFVTAAANELEIYALGGTPTAPTLTLRLGFADGANITVNAIKWNPVYQNIFAAGLANTGAGDNVQIWQYNVSANTVTKLTSLSGLGVAITAVDWSNDGNCLMVGFGSTAAAANKLNIYAYNASAATLTLTGGTIFTNATATSTAGRYSPVNNYIAQGASPTTTTAQLRISAPTVSCVTFSNLTLMLRNDVSIQNCCITFTGNCLIQSEDDMLSFAPTSTITVGPNSTLTLKNLTLHGLGSTTFVMSAASSALVLDNATLLLDGNYSFTQGSCTILNNVIISGQSSNFIYSSALTTTIAQDSSLLIDEQVTFSYAPSNGANNLLRCTDTSSQLILNGGTLAVPTNGLALTRGTFVVKRHAYIASDALVAAQGVQLGDGVVAANNMNVQIYPDAILEVQRGMLVNNNI